MPIWTEEQREAIETRGQNLLVSAAAGSGKTAVLSARVGEFVEQGGALDRLLIVTFTNAAAAEMRTRIARELNRRVAARPGDAHLRKQSLTLYKATICTIDSFGMNLLRRHAHRSGMSPDFTVLDETELIVLQNAVLQRQIEEYYREFPEGFGEFLALFGGDSDGVKLEQALKILSGKMDRLPFPEGWLDRQQERFSEADEWCREICRLILPVMREYGDIFDQVMAAAPFSDKDMVTVREETELIHALTQELAEEDWEAVCRRAQAFSFDRAPSVKKEMEWEAHLYREYRGRFRLWLKGELFHHTPQQCREDLSRQREGMTFLFRATRQFRKAVQEEMDRRAAYSFAVLADRALRLVIETYDHKTGTYTVTPIAKEEQAAYDEVLIDEYQDVDDLQDLLFRAVTRNNCFLVGDVKQSIYGFRGSNSENFLRKKETCKVIDLNRNFRSRKGILDLVNFLCKGLFSPETGGLFYDEKETLYPGRKDDEAVAYPREEGETTPQPDTELLFLSLDANAEETRIAKARLCAKLIRDAVEGGATVLDRKTDLPRPMTYSDVAILMRDATEFSLYETVFREFGVPLLSGSGETFLDSPEVCGMIAFLEAVNDPWNDLSLFIALTGSVFSLSAQSVAEIRLSAKGKSLWDGILACEATHPQAGRVARELRRFRILAENLPIPKLLWEIYSRTDYLALESATSPTARNNLMKFYSFACRYSRNDGLFGFLEFARRAKESGKVKESGSAPEGAFVKLLTIHGSKGLEFPWCIVPELETRFKFDRDNVIFDTEFGVACKGRNPEQTAEFTTLMREVIAHRARRAQISEELRILYVALTRPRDRLTLITPYPKEKDLPLFGLHSQGGTVRLIDRLNTPDCRAALMNRMVAHPKAPRLHTPFLSPEEGPAAEVRVEIVEPPTNPPSPQETPQPRCGLSEEALLRRFSFRYDDHLSTVPAKVSVTELAKAHADPDSALLLPEIPLSRPKFLDEQAVSAAERGTAIHTYCQFADFSLPVDLELDRLTREGHLSAAAADAVDRTQLERFLTGPLADLLNTSLGYQREVRFVCRIPVSYYSGNPGDEGEMLMQGAIDLLCETEEGFVVVDFKSDRADEGELLSRYARQLNLYATAVSRLYDKPVTGCKIWSFFLGRAIDVPEGAM